MSPPFEPGAQFPDLELQDTEGRKTRLGEAMDGKPAVVYFLRSASCPVCRNHLKALARQHNAIATSGAQVLSVVPDGPEAAKELATWLGLPVPVFTNSAHSHAEAGLEPVLWGKLQPSGTILLGKTRQVHYARHSAFPPMGYNERELLEALARGAHRTE